MKIEMATRGVTTLVHKKSCQILGMSLPAWIQSVLELSRQFDTSIHRKVQPIAIQFNVLTRAASKPFPPYSFFKKAQQ